LAVAIGNRFAERSCLTDFTRVLEVLA